MHTLEQILRSVAVVVQPLSCKNVKAKKRLLKSSPVGSMALKRIKQGIERGVIKAPNVKGYLKRFNKLLGSGTCQGQALNVMVAAKNIRSTAEIGANMSFANLFGFQILSDLEIGANVSRHLSVDFNHRLRQLKKSNVQEYKQIFAGKIEKVAAELIQEERSEKRSTKPIEKKLQRFKQNLHAKNKPQQVRKLVKKVVRKFATIEGRQKGVVGIDLQKRKTERIAKKYEDKNVKTSTQLLREHAGLTHIKTKKFLKNDSDKLLGFIRKLHAKQQHIVLKFDMAADTVGHEVTFFLKPDLALYDANFGLVQYRSIDEFLNAIKDIYLVENNFVEVKTHKYIIEVFKR